MSRRTASTGVAVSQEKIGAFERLLLPERRRRRLHHDLIHRGVCSVRGRAGIDLVFEWPTLVTERASETKPVQSSEPSATVDIIEDPPNEEASAEDEHSWREENVAAIFDGPPAPNPEPKYRDIGDFFAKWADEKLARDRADRAKRRLRRFDLPPSPSDRLVEHVCHEEEGDRAGGDDTQSGSQGVS